MNTFWSSGSDDDDLSVVIERLRSCLAKAQQPDMLIGVFRVLRNACSERADFVDKFSVDLIPLLVHWLTSNSDDVTKAALSEPTAVRVCLQLLANLTIRIPDSKDLVWRSLAVGGFTTLLRQTDLKVRRYSSALLYNCLNDRVVGEVLTERRCRPILRSCVIFADERQAWFRLILQRILRDLNSLQALMNACSGPGEQAALLSVFDESVLKNGEAHVSNFQFVCRLFITSSAKILDGSFDDQLVNVVNETVVVCCHATLDTVPAYAVVLRQNRTFVSSVSKVLNRVHRLSREGHPQFKMDRYYSSLSNGSEAAPRSSHGLKRNLVRLVANLCYKDEANKRIMRDSDTIAVLLECAAPDGNNLFITQWAIFAIRNLLEGCSENQQYLASLKRISPKLVVC